jgi:hypothetical protein
MSLKIEIIKISGEFVWSNDEIRFKSPLKACFLSGNFNKVSKVFLISLKTPQNFRHQFNEDIRSDSEIFIRVVKTFGSILELEECKVAKRQIRRCV